MRLFRFLHATDVDQDPNEPVFEISDKFRTLDEENHSFDDVLLSLYNALLDIFCALSPYLFASALDEEFPRASPRDSSLVCCFTVRFYSTRRRNKG